MRILTWLLATTAAVATAAWLFDGIYFDGADDPFSAELQDKILPLLLVSAIFGLTNMVVGKVLKVLALPLVILTLGLALLVINALMLLLTGWIAGEVGIGFTVDGFWNALGGSIIISLVGWLVGSLLKDD